MADEGWLAGARQVRSPNCDRRPTGAEVSLLVLHAISLPHGEYGGDAVERLFTNRLDPAAHPSFADLAGLRVSCHFLVRRDGGLIQFVPLQQRAWHAGASRWRGRERCNDFSVGIELEGTDTSPFADAQYTQLANLARSLYVLLPIRQLAAHSDVAPGRKTDPGAHFDWARLLADLARPS
ncbi:MAG: 1,6-anhydro-N-acetylmuramyl-L-alanine amidase AmpD [Betaproteobacteria bacterium]|nr:1,6-anhydro-N-acetylmuramyl-L-alanine amidase AmpD [Betaproteobacteria bacterium]MSQ88079.1 1,6-anhydro-N-acetylmuramyl-L-alanine amidase AmpD [Betaproteobacteria bacterium]